MYTYIYLYIYIVLCIYIYCSQHFFLLCLGASLCNSGLLVGSKLSKQNETSLSGDAMASNEISFWPISPESSLANVNDLYVLSGPDIVSNIAIRTNPKRNEEFQKTQCHHSTRHKQLRSKNTKTTQKYVSTIAISIRSCQFELLGIGVVASFKDAHPSNKCNVETSSVKRSVRKCKIMQIWKRSAVRGENSSDIRCSARDSCFASLHPSLTKLKKTIGKRSWSKFLALPRSVSLKVTQRLPQTQERLTSLLVRPSFWPVTLEIFLGNPFLPKLSQKFQ